MGSSPSKQTASTPPFRAFSPALTTNFPDEQPVKPSTSLMPTPPSSPPTPPTPSSFPPSNYAAYEYEYTYPFCPCCHRDFRESCDDHRETSREQDAVIRRSFGFEADKLGMTEEHVANAVECERKTTGGTGQWERDMSDLERVLMWPHLV